MHGEIFPFMVRVMSWQLYSISNNLRQASIPVFVKFSSLKYKIFLFDLHFSPSFFYVLFPHLNMLSVGMFLWKPSVMVELEWPLTSEVSLLVTGLATSQASRARMISEKSAALMFLKCSCSVSTSFKSCHETEYFTIQLCFST